MMSRSNTIPTLLLTMAVVACEVRSDLGPDELGSPPADERRIDGGAEDLLPEHETGVLTQALVSVARIQAEDYRTGGEGVGYHDTTTSNLGGAYRSDAVDIQPTTDTAGGYNIGWVVDGEWLSYTLTADVPGVYAFTARVASARTGTKALHIVVDGTAISAPVTYTDASGWQSWRNLELGEVTLAAGTHTVRLVADLGGINVNHIDVTVEPSCTVSDLLVPSCGAWWGMWTNTTQSGSGGTWSSRLAELETDVGRDFDILHNYHQWGDAFPTAEETARAQGGQLLLLNWKSPSVGWGSIASGAQDAVIDAAAVRVAGLAPHRVMIAFHHEPEDEVGSSYGTARDYANAYRRIHDRFRARGVTNVVWVWNLIGWRSWYTMYAARELYPGDDYVDWIAWDPYRFGVGTCGRTVDLDRTFAEMVSETYTWFMDNGFGHKPFMLGEYGTRDEQSSWGESNATFFRGIPAALRTSFPNLRALVYFNNRVSDNPTCDSNLWDSATTRAGYRDAGHDPYLNQSRPRADPNSEEL